MAQEEIIRSMRIVQARLGSLKQNDGGGELFQYFPHQSFLEVPHSHSLKLDPPQKEKLFC